MFENDILKTESRSVFIAAAAPEIPLSWALETIRLPGAFPRADPLRQAAQNTVNEKALKAKQCVF
jgi:hypothetical protein